MSDVVVGKCVIGRVTAYDRSWKCECLMFRVRGEFHMIYIKRKGSTDATKDRPIWEYEERDGRLHLQPSLLVTAGRNKNFHTAFHWSVDFVRPTKRQNPHKVFDRVNPPPKGESI